MSERAGKITTYGRSHDLPDQRDHFVPSMKYLIRIMSVLEKQNEITITNLAMLSRINHDRCSCHLKWLESTGIVIIKIYGNKKYVILTEQGISYAKKILELALINHQEH